MTTIDLQLHLLRPKYTGARLRGIAPYRGRVNGKIINLTNSSYHH